MKTVVVIPARYKSSRFPGKPLVLLLGKPMILWVSELAARAVSKENVFIATDDARIAELVSENGFQAVMTSGEALTGTDRLAEACEQIQADIYINVQGDEPLVDPEDIIRVKNEKEANYGSVINGFSYISHDENPSNVNIPKVVTNEKDELVYMSRLPIPGFKDQKNRPEKYKKQVCIYAFTKEELRKFAGFGRKSYLESFEDIEILRFLEVGVPIKMLETKPGSLAVDIPEDVLAVEKALRNSLEGVK